MPVIKTILKKVRQQASVKLIGDGQANITSFDLKLSDDTLDQANVRMNITGMMWTTPGPNPIVVSRDGTVVMYLNGNDNWSMTQMFGISDTANNNANIAVAMPANSLIYLTISKPAGFIEPNQQNNYTNE
jgi:hypothetical protein